MRFLISELFLNYFSFFGCHFSFVKSEKKNENFKAINSVSFNLSPYDCLQILLIVVFVSLGSDPRSIKCYGQGPTLSGSNDEIGKPPVNRSRFCEGWKDYVYITD